jgi:hypothetical protein
MGEQDKRVAAVLRHVDASRRSFLTKLLIGTAFAPPAIASFTLAAPAWAGAPDGTGGSTPLGTTPPGSTPPGSTPPGSTPPGSSGLTSPPMTTPPPQTTGPTIHPRVTVLYADADTFIRRASRNTNEGANIRLYVSVKPACRVLVQFNREDVIDAVNNLGNGRVKLVLTIASNHNTWGQAEGRGVSASPLGVEFSEGNGAQALLPRSQGVRGSGVGATWHSPADPDTANGRFDAHAPRWRKRDIGDPTGPVVIHRNQQTGPVEFDVTDDVLAGAYDWMVGMDRENMSAAGDDTDDDQHFRSARLGYERFRGAVEYYSREGAAAAMDQDLGPRLVFGV